MKVRILTDANYFKIACALARAQAIATKHELDEEDDRRIADDALADECARIEYLRDNPGRPK